jgi:hypothetical protein
MDSMLGRPIARPRKDPEPSASYWVRGKKSVSKDALQPHDLPPECQDEPIYRFLNYEALKTYFRIGDGRDKPFKMAKWYCTKNKPLPNQVNGFVRLYLVQR